MIPRDEVMLNLDIRQLGLGNGSCGPEALDCYAFPNQCEAWSVTLVPVRGATHEKLRSAAQGIKQNIPTAPRKRSVRESGMGFDGG